MTACRRVVVPALRHDNLPSASLTAAHQVAWDTYLPRLAAVTAGADPGPDPHSAT